MIGLVVVVVLLVFVGLFAFIFMSGNYEDKHEDLFLGMKASNLANSLTFLSVGSSEFGSRAVECCAGIDNAACTDVEVSAEAGMDMFDERASFVLECVSGQEVIYGDCSTGINSEKIVLSTGDRFFIRICRK